MNAQIELVEKDGGIVGLCISSEDHGGVHNAASLFYELDLETELVKGSANFCVKFDVFFTTEGFGWSTLYERLAFVGILADDAQDVVRDVQEQLKTLQEGPEEPDFFNNLLDLLGVDPEDVSLMNEQVAVAEKQMPVCV